MKFIILIGMIYGIYRVSQMAKAIEAKKQDKLTQEEDTGFTDYEEVD